MAVSCCVVPFASDVVAGVTDSDARAADVTVTVIVGKSTLDEAIKSTDVPNLDVLPCGPTPPNPSELLHTARFAKVLQDCAARYDRVILDSPPLQPVTDAVVLSPRADAVVLVIRSAQTTKQALRRSRDVLMQVNANVVGVLLNAVDLSSPDYYYYYEYQGKYARYYREGDSSQEEEDDLEEPPSSSSA